MPVVLFRIAIEADAKARDDVDCDRECIGLGNLNITRDVDPTESLNRWQNLSALLNVGKTLQIDH